ncbi:hypothetical protein J7337_008825 [Fusarium musae]|uniref:Uncharacterized protein n=1 Tax=Fusarium musae TaxID=1042133 RepID=A0A9P8DE97_9HYPO|nr:hypothetical protein J7337_008825 [Fusarium musae]KAG9500349.1 hypothetical protein J7337_008825 [Fusarium musae]
MGFPSNTASNAVIYVTYALFLFVSDLAYIFVLKANHHNRLMGTGIAWKMRNQSKADFLSGNGTQTAFPLALNFIASGE